MGKGRWGSIHLIEFFWPAHAENRLAPKIREILWLKVRGPKLGRGCGLGLVSELEV